MPKLCLPCVVLAFGLLAASPLVFAQSVNIGGTTLQLGASRGEALAEANALFDLLPTRIRGQYNIYPKRELGANGPPYPPAIGSITIENERLTRVTRNLGSFRSDSAETAIQNLIAAFARAPNQGNAPAVHTDTALKGDASTSRVYFTYPDRAIQIVVYQPANRAGKATIDISEQYALSPDRGPAAPAED